MSSSSSPYSFAPSLQIQPLVESLKYTRKSVNHTVKALGDCYQFQTLDRSTIQLRRRLFIEIWMYGEVVHPKTLSIVQEVKNMTDMYRFATPPAVNDLFERFQFHQNGNDINLQLEIAYTHVCETSSDLYLATKQAHERHQSKVVPEHTRDTDSSHRPDQNIRNAETGNIVTGHTGGTAPVNRFWSGLFGGILSNSTTSAHIDDRETVNLGIIAAAAKSYRQSLKLLTELLPLLRRFMEAMIAELAVFRSNGITGTSFPPSTIQSTLGIKGEDIIEACVELLLTQMDQIMRMHSIRDEISKEDQREWCERLESKKSVRIDIVD